MLRNSLKILIFFSPLAAWQKWRRHGVAKKVFALHALRKLVETIWTILIWFWSWYAWPYQSFLWPHSDRSHPCKFHLPLVKDCREQSSKAKKIFFYLGKLWETFGVWSLIKMEASWVNINASKRSRHVCWKWFLALIFLMKAEICYSRSFLHFEKKRNTNYILEKERKEKKKIEEWLQGFSDFIIQTPKKACFDRSRFRLTLPEWVRKKFK